ncbi:hypothetical protein LMG32289_05525 [Cupriavidus pampae]|uniref:Uncharacterized protein n=1 Tax=Cupriavidus pampae TaxID=659251 RepID=A0ABN7ZG00_9BURK|nr:hypothetical protein LMG32289_05525 [Cupriavidus pampae]
MTERFYGRVLAPEAKRAVLESLGVEVAPLRSHDDLWFHVRCGIDGYDALGALGDEYEHALARRAPDIHGPLSVVTLGRQARDAEAAYLDFVAAHLGPLPAWHGIQQAALAGEGVQWRAGLSDAQIAAVLAAQGEGMSPAKVGRYPTLDALVARAGGSRHWAEGEIFSFALDDTRFVVMKQIAPASCEMMTFTQNGFHTVLSAYRYTPQELADALMGYMGAAHAPALRYQQAPGTALNGFVVGHRAKLYRRDAGEATIVGVRAEAGRPLVALQFDTTQYTDAPQRAPFLHLELDGTELAATWAPTPPAAPGTVTPDGRRVRVLPDTPPYRDAILLLHGTRIEFTGEDGKTHTGRVGNKYTVDDRAAGRAITVRTEGFHPRNPSAGSATISEEAITRIVELSGGSADYARTPREARIATVAAMRFRAQWDTTFAQPGEREVDAANFSAAAGYTDADRRAIAALAVGQEWVCPTYGRSHTVRRLPDGGLTPDPARMAVIEQEFVAPETPSPPTACASARGTDLQP